MKEFIASFIDQKELSENSQSALFLWFGPICWSQFMESDTDEFENLQASIKILNRRFKELKIIRC